MKTILLILAYFLYFILPSFCQLNTFAETIPIVSIKYSPLSEIIRHVLIEEKSKNYYSDTLSFMVRYGDTIFQRDISMDSNPTYYINAGTPVYMFVITPCPEGIPTIDDNSFYLLKYNNHYFYLMNYNGNKCDSSLFSYPGESIDRNLILQTHPMEDDRWPDYFYYSSMDSSGHFFGEGNNHNHLLHKELYYMDNYRKTLSC